MSGVSTPSPRLSSTMTLTVPQSTKRPLVELGPDLRARSPRQQAHALARAAQREHKEAHAAIFAGGRVAYHRPIAAVVDLAFLAGCGGDHDSRLGRRGTAQRHDEPADTRVPCGEAVIVDEVL